MVTGRAKLLWDDGGRSHPREGVIWRSGIWGFLCRTTYKIVLEKRVSVERGFYVVRSSALRTWMWIEIIRMKSFSVSKRRSASSPLHIEFRKFFFLVSKLVKIKKILPASY